MFFTIIRQADYWFEFDFDWKCSILLSTADVSTIKIHFIATLLGPATPLAEMKSWTYSEWRTTAKSSTAKVAVCLKSSDCDRGEQHRLHLQAPFIANLDLDSIAIITTNFTEAYLKIGVRFPCSLKKWYSKVITIITKRLSNARLIAF
jgi:hypothetical protein